MNDEEERHASMLDVESALYGAIATINMKHIPVGIHPPTGVLAGPVIAAQHALELGLGMPSMPTTPSVEATATTPKATRGRPRMHGPGRKKNQSLRKPVTYAHKLAVINFYEAHDKDINATVREFYANLTPSNIGSRKRQIYKWVKERETIEEMCFKQTTAGQSRRREKGTATTLSNEAEQELVDWIVALRQSGMTISSPMIKTKAIEIADKYGVPKGSFQATWSWQQGFFKRHHIAMASVPSTTNDSDGMIV
ncbi:hypothetical protein Poli38472_014306 [Pythium oligandrum]|uniref:HTH CENPB-type domain-containing protein n=1 Tax=Pythium oligandrum TaxID=41045 RepID=A0A8K1FGE3_PYTOL|nr:hypothetical protein Poli38472_014306 [Pythium oligandrum]|eukprot:TMW57703.1 hypothetical protein Poli38472_014306 [Pythium oligandrum]